MPSEDDDLVQRELFVRTFFPGRPPERVTNQFVASMRNVDFPAETVLFREGDPAEQIIFVLTGQVRMTAAGRSDWTFGEESMIGILDASMRRPYQRTAIAETDVEAIVLDFDDYREIMEDNFEFSKNLMIGALRNIHERSLTAPPEHVFPPTEVQQEAVTWEQIIESGRALNQIEKLMVLHNSRYLQDAPIQPLVTLAGLAAEESWSAGDTIFEPEQTSDVIRIVARGTITVSRDRPKISAPFGPGGMLGASAALGHSVYEYRAVAETDATTLRLTKEELYDVMEDHFGLALAMFAFVGREHERIRDVLAQAEAKQKEMA